MPRNIYDISMPLSGDTDVFPGDTPLQIRFLHSVAAGDNLTLSEFSCTSHIGTHADAPVHYINGGQTIGEIDLRIFIGACRVILLDSSVDTPIMPEEIELLADLPERVLFCTKTGNENKDIKYRIPSLALVDYLNQKGVKLIGVDNISVDMMDDDKAMVHKRIFSYGMVILENLYLKGIPEGIYELIALPLKFMKLEASPVRAILRDL